MTIIEAIKDKSLLGMCFDDLKSWESWLTVLKAFYGLNPPRVPDYFEWDHAGPLLGKLKNTCDAITHSKDRPECPITYILDEEGTNCECALTPTAIVTAFLLGGEG